MATDLIRGGSPGAVELGGFEIEDLKERVLDTAAQRETTWISELFYDDPGPHVETCPMAERGAGSLEAFYALEATGSLDTADRLRADLARDVSGARQIGERLAFTFRQLRERSVTFGHPEAGRIARRAAAAVRAALEGPTRRLQALAIDLAVTIGAMRDYLRSQDDASRHRALQRAEASLHMATQRSESAVVPIDSLTYAPDEAINRAKQLRSEVGGMLRSGAIDVDRAHSLLEEALDLIEHALERSGRSV